jgi:hypothetical protein
MYRAYTRVYRYRVYTRVYRCTACIHVCIGVLRVYTCVSVPCVSAQATKWLILKKSFKKSEQFVRNSEFDGIESFAYVYMDLIHKIW